MEQVDHVRLYLHHFVWKLTALGTGQEDKKKLLYSFLLLTLWFILHDPVNWAMLRLSSRIALIDSD